MPDPGMAFCRELGACLVLDREKHNIVRSWNKLKPRKVDLRRVSYQINILYYDTIRLSCLS